jgi:hypothetical protein
MSTTIINHVIAVLSFPRKVADLLFHAKAIQKAMNGNANFPGSNSKVIQLQMDIATLYAAELEVNNKPTDL